MLPLAALFSQLLQESNAAAVCSNPPSEVGIGITASPAVCRPLFEELLFLMDRGRKYMYICVVNRFGRPGGVTQRVNGINESVRMSIFWIERHDQLCKHTGVYNTTL